MKRLILSFVLFAALAALPAAAQSMEVGLSIGANENLEDGFDVDLNDSVKEVSFATALDPDTFFRVKGGQADSSNGTDFGATRDDGRIEYLDAVVEYRFSEIFGSSALYLGPGFYRQKFAGADDSDYGLTAGVNAVFPVTRRLGLTAEVGYHWVHFDQKYTFLTATGGVRFAF